MNALLTPQPWPLQRRAMQAADLVAVVNVEARAYSHPWSRGNFIDSLAAGYIAELLDAREAGVVGYFVAMPGVDELHLLNITVAPDWQGRGHGSALLDVVQAHAAERGLATLWLEVRESNQRARALYRRRGFAEVGLRRGYYPAAGGREDAVVMSLPLARRDESHRP
jgi:[ribosomal protein S18]-alanine N-acetyltransferase